MDKMKNETQLMSHFWWWKYENIRTELLAGPCPEEKRKGF